MKPILVVGETNVDVVMYGVPSAPAPGQEITAEDCLLTLGSASAICAMGLARLGNRVIFVSRAGTDLWGDFCLDALSGRGIDTTHVVRDAAIKTGVTVSISSRADRALVTYVGSIGEVSESDVPDALLDGVQHLHVSSYFLQSRLRPALPALFERARRRGVTTSLDPGFDPAHRWSGDLRQVVGAVDVFLPNDIELRATTRCASVEDGLLALENGRTRTVVKLGRDGAMTRDEGSIVRMPGFTVDAADTTGAGDSFNAGFLHGFVRGEPLAACLLRANACGALSTRALGGTTAQPVIEEVNALIAQRQGSR
jgi:sugar/nucleoside kinase (ribokinase family)